MAKVRLLGGKPLMVGGKVALSDDCCCAEPPTGCVLPSSGECPHSICFEIKLDSNDTSDGNFSDLLSGSFIGSFFDGVDWWVFGNGNFSTLTAIDPYDTWHSFVIQITKLTDTDIRVNWSVDGVAAPSFDDTVGASPSFDDTFRVGADFGTGAAHRSMRNIILLGNPDTPEEDFIFPTDSFDSFTAGASVIGDELRIDGTGDQHATKDLAPAYSLSCKCNSSCVGYSPHSNPLDGNCYLSHLNPQNCDNANGCPTNDPNSCYSGNVSCTNKYMDTITTYTGCLNPNPVFSNCTSTGEVIVKETLDPYTCELVVTCLNDGPITYMCELPTCLCFNFPDQGCDGTPSFLTKIQTNVNTEWPC